MLAAVGVAVLAGATVFAFNAWVWSPFPNFMSDLTATAAGEGAGAAISAFWKHLGENAVALLRGDAIERGLRLQVGLLVVVAVFGHPHRAARPPRAGVT